VPVQHHLGTMSTAIPRRVAPGSPAFIGLIAAMMTMTAMTIDINLPSIPATAADLGASVATTQFTVTIFFAGFAIGQLVWGPLSDRTGRRPGVLIGTGVFLAATVGCALAPNIESLLAFRALEGFGAGAGSVLGRVIIRDLFDGVEMARILSLALAAFITAPIVAPSIGAVILHFASWRWIYGFLAIYGIVILLLATLLLEESRKARPPADDGIAGFLLGFAAVFRDPRSRAWSLVVILCFGTLTVYLTNSPAVLMQAYGLGPSAFGIAFALVAVCFSVGNLLNSRLVRHLPLPLLVERAQAASALGAAMAFGVAASGVGGVWALVATIGLFFVAFGLVTANATTLALQPHAERAGSATAALGFAQTVLPALLGGAVALFYDGTALPMLTSIFLLFATGWLVARRAGHAPPRSR
jgi:DHA1 family bicyclomycin/chloramphenicol resistance-like MFS transporter